MQNKFHLIIRSREGVVYNGEVTALTSKNEAGKFDILAEHANFISLINSLLEVHDLEGKVKELKIDNGLLRVKGNTVEVYLGIEGLVPYQTISDRPTSEINSKI